MHAKNAFLQGQIYRSLQNTYCFLKRQTIIRHNYLKLIFAAIIVALLSSLLAYALKYLTEYGEHYFQEHIQRTHSLLYIIAPTIGITAIYFLRKYFFKGRKNKGITEIYKTLDQRKDHLPLFKVPSHFINGFLTVIFGGSTGVEVSTVVATATIGNAVYERDFSAKQYKRELVCAGVTAGVATLFVSPLGGWLFAMEVIGRKKDITLFLSCTFAALTSWVFIFLIDSQPLFHMRVTEWTWYALPFFVLLSMAGGLLSIYFTLLVTRMKKLFANIENNFIRVNAGAVSVGLLVWLFPVLYGDSYHGLKEFLNLSSVSILTLLLIAVLKPLAASLTLGAGGDGGVFAPSIVAGAFLGMAFAALCNLYFGTHLIPFNFALVGAAATLSAAIYAPLTAIVLVCNLIPNGYDLFLPLLFGSFIAKLTAQRILPYNVYTYDFWLQAQSQAK